jgi:adenylate cyclase
MCYDSSNALTKGGAVGGKNVRRRLAAILAADVAGYSRLMGEDEEGSLRRLQGHRRNLIDPKISEHHGRIVKTTGDGMLVEFASVLDAVRCAVEVQRAMLDRETEPEEERIRFRIGINLGDIIVDGDDIFGDGVNIAARLEALSEPGGVCVSGTVWEQIDGKLPYHFADLGPQAVKNIKRPVRAHMLAAAAVARTSVAAPRSDSGHSAAGARSAGRPAARRRHTETKPAPPLSIVVLPFANLSNDPEQEYFVDAITEDLTTDLSRISGSFVIARTTAFTYKGKPVDVKRIGRELNVRYVLEGSVRRLGEQVQVNVQLIDTETGAHAWADRFDTDRGNLAMAQSAITGRLAVSLKVELATAVGRQIEQKSPAGLDAQDLAMRRWAAFYLPASENNVAQALQLFERALQIDPASTEAKVGIAEILTQNAIKGWSKSPEEDQARAEKLVTEVLERNNNHPWAHFTLGEIRRALQHRFAEARIELEKALSLDRNHSGALLQLGYTLNDMGEPEKALPYFEKALQLTPRHPNIQYQYSGLGVCHLLLGHADESVDFLRKARAANSRIWYVHLTLAGALGLRGDLDEAKASLADLQRLRPDLCSLKQLRDLFARLRAACPQAGELWEKTLFVGLGRAEMPEE